MSTTSQEHTQQTTIYVGHLPRNSNEEIIHQLLSPYGKISKIVMHNNPTTTFAFVTFDTHEEAANAIHECNYTKINGQTIQISWFEIKPREYAPDSKLIITNLPTSVDELQLHEALEAYGPVINCTIFRTGKGESTGVGNVQFENADDARSAHEALQNASIGNQTISVDFYKPIDKRQDIILKLPPTVICVSGPEDLINEESLRSMFQEYGEIFNVKIMDGYGVVFFENTTSVSRANAEFHNPKLNVTTTVRKEIQQNILRIVESQRVFISDISISSEEEIRQHLESAGKIASLELRQRPGGDTTGIAQYESKEARDRAIQILDRSVFGSQVTPMRVLPYYDKRLDHPSAGLLQINELPCYVTIPNLREEMRQYGNVIAISVVATTQVTCIGYILFENFSEAEKAHTESKYVNTFLYPELAVNDIIGAFCENLAARIVICYNIDQNETATTFCDKMKPIATVDGLWLANEDGKKTIIFSCMTPTGVISAINFLRSQGTECDVLGVHIMARANKLLVSIPMQKEARDRLLYCNGIGTQTTNSRLREIFETIGKVESAMVIYSPLNNDTTQKGVVLYKELPDAVVALKTPPKASEFAINFNVQELRVRGEFNQQIPPPNQQLLINQQLQQQQQQQQQQQHMPMHHQQNSRNFRPREEMRKFIKKYADAKDQARLNEEASKLCVNDVYEIACDENRMKIWADEKLQK